MTNKRRPQCFVAMAFGHEDTTVLYDDSIRPLLISLGIRPFMMERKQTNNDLNVEIIAALDRSHLCIADLTYARPSVYYEAGYAARAVPVIYTARSDHVRSSAPDNARVHFDLAMKPIIFWNMKNSTAFQNKLRARIRVTFLKTWLAKETLAREREKSAAAFRCLSLQQRLRLLRVRFSGPLSEAGYGDWEAYSLPVRASTRDAVSFHDIVAHAPGPNLLARRRDSRAEHIITIHGLRDATKASLLEHVLNVRYARDLYWGDSSRPPRKQVFVHHVYLCLRGLSTSTIETGIPDVALEPSGRWYFKTVQVRDRHWDRSVREFFYFSPTLVSEPDIVQYAKQVVSTSAEAERS